jgi:hypothetical protein
MTMFAISVEAGVYLRIAASLSIFVLLWFLNAMFRREAVKRDLRQRGNKPKRIWWIVFAWWSPWFYTMPFRVIYSDQKGYVHKARCYVFGLLAASYFGSSRVKWFKDEIIGELPLPEVWASDEIIHPKLKNQNLSGEANRLLENQDESE